jgi:hypothetical protein
VDVAARLYEEAAKRLAADSMTKAVKAADAAVAEIAKALAADLVAAEEVVAQARGQVKRALKDRFDDGLDFRGAVLRRRAQVQKDYAAAASDAAKDARTLGELSATNALLAATEPWAGKLDADLAAVDARFDAELVLIARTRSLIAAWAQAHSALGPALESGRRLDVRRLVELAVDLREMVRKGEKP